MLRFKDKNSEIYANFPCDFYDKQLSSRGLRQIWHVRRRNFTKSLVNKYYQNKDILIDIGCGNCLWNKASMPVVGIDICESMLRYNQQKNPIFAPLVADISESLPIKSETVGLVIITEVLEHFYSHDHIIEEIWRVLKKDGVVIVSVPYAQFPGLWGILFPLWCKFKGWKDKNEYYLNNCGHVTDFTPQTLFDIFHRFVLLERRNLDSMTIFFVGRKK